MTQEARPARITRRSEELYRRALNVLVDGVASPSRGALNYGRYPLFIERGVGGFPVTQFGGVRALDGQAGDKEDGIEVDALLTFDQCRKLVDRGPG